MTGSDLKERVRVRSLVFDDGADAWSWADAWTAWAKVEPDIRLNLFSGVGIGARGVVLTMRKNPRLTLYKSGWWQGQFCFFTAITDAEPGFVTVRAALCDVVTCRRDMDKALPGYRFPGILTEKYVRHEEENPHGVVTRLWVLVTPKDVALAPGGWVLVGREHFEVLVPHELDPYKNEYEVRREEDC